MIYLAVLASAGVAQLALPPPRSSLTADAPRQRAGASRGHALRPVELSRSAAPVDQPRMRRWEPLVWQVVRGDPAAFAMVMTFIFVESSGYQFAVSRTSCIGLMQFCSRTALRRPFDAIFDIDAVRPCRCGGRCRVAWRTRWFLETSDRALHPLVAEEFPCSLTDARFDPEQAIRAGWAYISQLSAAFGGNIYLTYIGYNSGPPAAARIWRALGTETPLTLDAIGRVLRRALIPEFGRRAGRRAQSLMRAHLPKLGRVHQLYLDAEGVAGALPFYTEGAERCAAARPPCRSQAAWRDSADARARPGRARGPRRRARASARTRGRGRGTARTRRR